MYSDDNIKKAVETVRQVLSQVKADLNTHITIQQSMDLIDKELQKVDNGDIPKDISGTI
jgi:50S ribosomal subunit-associated GTPase HflX